VPVAWAIVYGVKNVSAASRPDVLGKIGLFLPRQHRHCVPQNAYPPHINTALGPGLLRKNHPKISNYPQLKIKETSGLTANKWELYLYNFPNRLFHFYSSSSELSLSKNYQCEAA
jgi:hypothetical protein